MMLISESRGVIGNTIRHNTAPAAGADQGMLGIGNEGVLDGDAIVQLKHLFTNHYPGAAPPGGVGNVHGFYDGITYSNTAASSDGLIIAGVFSAALRSTNTQNITGVLSGAMGVAEAEASSAGTVTWAQAFRADSNWQGATATNFALYYGRDIQGTGPVTNYYGLYLDPMARASTNAKGIYIGNVTGGTTLNYGIEWNTHLIYSAGAFAFQEATTVSTPAATNLILTQGTTADLILGGLNTSAKVFLRGNQVQVQDGSNVNVFATDLANKRWGFVNGSRVRIGATTAHSTEGTNFLSLFLGTAPAGTLASGGSLYVATATNVELNYIDSAGNAQQLSTT